MSLGSRWTAFLNDLSAFLSLAGLLESVAEHVPDRTVFGVLLGHLFEQLDGLLGLFLPQMNLGQRQRGGHMVAIDLESAAKLFDRGLEIVLLEHVVIGREHMALNAPFFALGAPVAALVTSPRLGRGDTDQKITREGSARSIGRCDCLGRGQGKDRDEDSDR